MIRKDTQIKFYKPVAVTTLTHRSEIWSITKEKWEAKTEIAEMRFLRNAAGYTRRDQIRNTKLGKS
jgi:hypothetical protein